MVIDNPGQLLRAGNFKLFLQPKHSINCGGIVGAESLSRLFSDDGSLIMPGEYIVDFENTGFISELDFHILEQVCIFLSDWEGFFDSIKKIPISVNFSKKTLSDENFFERFVSVVSLYDIEPELIEIEISELRVFDDFNVAKLSIDQLRSNGYSVAIDDYGKNSSAFTIIRHCDVDVLKVDREMIVDCDEGNKAYMIMEAAVGLAKKLGISVVAEGVETEEQLENVKKIGCDVVQGWYFSKALSKSDFIDYVKAANQFVYV